MSENKKLTPAEKRKQTLAKKKVVDEYSQIASSALTTFGGDEEQKVEMLKTIHRSVLGLTKSGQARPFSDLRLFMMQANQRKLDPFKKQIHAVYIWDSSRKMEVLTPITGIDGFRAIAQRSERPLFAGTSEPVFEYKNPDDPYPFKCTVQAFAYNPVTGAREAITTGVAIWDEYVKLVDEYDDKRQPTGRKIPNSTWKRMPTVMLAKCAEALALRKAFPDDLGGLYVKEELEHIESEPDNGEDDDELERKIQERMKNFDKAKAAQEGEVVEDKAE